MSEYIEREAVLIYAKMLVHTAYERKEKITDDEIEKLVYGIHADFTGAELGAIPTADVVEVDSVIPFVRVCDRKEYIKNSEKLINEYLAELLERFGIRCLAQRDNINGTVKFWAEKMDGGVSDAAD